MFQSDKPGAPRAGLRQALRDSNPSLSLAVTRKRTNFPRTRNWGLEKRYIFSKTRVYTLLLFAECDVLSRLLPRSDERRLCPARPSLLAPTQPGSGSDRLLLSASRYMNQRSSLAFITVEIAASTAAEGQPAVCVRNFLAACNKPES